MAASNKPIRVGIIRLDTHGMYYGAILGKHDPLLLMDPRVGFENVPIRYSWQTGGVHFYFYTHYADPKKWTVATVDGFEIVRVWDEDREVAECYANIFDSKPQVCASYDEVSDGVDLVLIADCNGDGSDHLKLASPSLKKGMPTFIDKPFAYEVKDAKALLRLARKHDTPLMSSSMLLQLPQATRFRDRFQEIGEPEFGTVKGGGTAMAGHIHAISLAVHLFGDGVESVECMGAEPLAHVLLNYGGKPHRPSKGVALNCDAGGSPHCAFYASAYSSQGAIHSPELGDWIFPYGAARILEMAKSMVKTRKPPIPYDSMLELIAIGEAARRSQELRQRVEVRVVL